MNKSAKKGSWCSGLLEQSPCNVTAALKLPLQIRGSVSAHRSGSNLWRGISYLLIPGISGRDAILKALPGMARYLHSNALPPAKVKSDGSIEDPKGPVGFSAALLPYLSALGEKNLENEQMSRVQSEFNSKTGLYGNPPKYYDQNMALFALAACLTKVERRSLVSP